MRLQASKAYIWAKEDGCTGYTRLYQTARPESERDMSAANEGRQAHDIAARVLNNPSLTGDGEMWEYAQIYMNHVYETMTENAIMFVEEKLISSFSADVTPIVDCATYDPDNRVLRVYEYKYGTSPVDVENNQQLMLGVDALLKKYDLAPAEIYLHVYQPRAFHRDGDFRTWSLYLNVLRDFIEIAIKREDEHKSGNGMCRTGHHCLRCPAMLKCEAHTKSTMNCLEFTELPEEWDRDPESIGAEYRLVKRIAKQLEKRLEALQQEVLMLTEEGKNTGFILGERTQALSWFRPVGEMVEIAKALGLDILKAPAIITPKQALDRKILTEEQLLGFAGRPSPVKVLKEMDSKLLKELDK